MRVFASVLLAVSSAVAYQVTYPDDDQGWTTAGPNYLKWIRVDTDPLNFTAFLTNMNTAVMPNSQVLDALVDGTLGSIVCNPPTGGWQTGSGFRVNLAEDAQHPDSLLAQSNEFNITAPSSSGGATASSVSTLMSTSAVTPTTALLPGVSSSDTSTTPTGISAASRGADSQTGLFTAVAALTAIVSTLF